jgi:hypothetical protein
MIAAQNAITSDGQSVADLSISVIDNRIKECHLPQLRAIGPVELREIDGFININPLLHHSKSKWSVA